MKHTQQLVSVVLISLIAVSGFAKTDEIYRQKQLQEIDAFNAEGQWQTNWDSLTKHPIPEWFRDAKFGIYAHLGVYCVPAFGTEWYPRKMYQTDNEVYQHHIDTYGDQSQFGYKDFVPQFTMENFDAAQWAQLYKDAGAQFAGPVAEHHDGFSMWASRINRWNTKDMGPKRDVSGELVREIRKRDMRVICSFHHAFNIYDYYTPKEQWDTGNPQFADLYGYPQMKDRTLALARWLIKLKEVIDNYRPDQVWFDFAIKKVPAEYTTKMAAYFYNHEKTWGRDLIITRKKDHLPEGVGVLDIERGRMKGMGQELWQTDDSTAYNSWSWVQNLDVKPAIEMVHNLVDIVSKNGVLLLNVCPKADGTISSEQQQMLRNMGQWLKINGEAIYATRPWTWYGEGPTHMEQGGGFLDTIHYTNADIRYTRSKDGKTLYAIVLGWPLGELTLHLPEISSAEKNAMITLLGHGPVSYKVGEDKRLTLSLPNLSAKNRPCEHAYVFKLNGFDIQPSQDIAFDMPGAMTLSAAHAVFNGAQINLRNHHGHLNIDNWHDAAESVHWLTYVEKPGVYRVRGEVSANQPCQLTLVGGKEDLVLEIPKTGNWYVNKVINFGTIELDKVGINHLTLKATNTKKHKPVGIWKLQLVSANTKVE